MYLLKINVRMNVFKDVIKRNLFINEVSQSKKIRKIMDFSVVLDWYEENKENLAKTLGKDVSLFPSAEMIIKYSKGLNDFIINPQSGGNQGNSTSFSDFKTLDKFLIHDILHLLYNLEKKEFDKSLTNLEYSESELIEEIEVLAVEESFMKYMGIPHPKMDFINQNINQLGSYLITTILKNEPQRFIDMALGKIEPYIEVYGHRYKVKGTAYERLFDLVKLPKSLVQRGGKKIKNESEFKFFLNQLLDQVFYSELPNADRSKFPRIERSIDKHDIKKPPTLDLDSFTVEELIDKVLSTENGGRFFRRVFRKEDILVNATNQYKTEDERSVAQKTKFADDPIHKRNIDFPKRKPIESKYAFDYNGKMKRKNNFKDFIKKDDKINYVSLSKNLLTKNAKELKNILYSLQGYMIKNYKNIKSAKKGYDLKKEIEIIKKKFDDILLTKGLDYLFHHKKVIFEYNFENEDLKTKIGVFGLDSYDVDFKKSLEIVLLKREEFKDVLSSFDNNYERLLYFYILEKLGGDSNDFIFNNLLDFKFKDSPRYITILNDGIKKHFIVMKTIKKIGGLIPKIFENGKIRFNKDTITKKFNSNGIDIKNEQYDFEQYINKGELIFYLNHI